MVEIREILCPTDLSEASHHALQHAAVIAKWYDARITALHVVYVPIPTEAAILSAGLDHTAQPAEPDIHEREQDLQAWVEPVREAGIKTDVCVEEGDAARGILRHVKSHASDLIVMGTHGAGGFERFMLGSVTEKVLRKATCPVMTVPPAAATAARVPYKRLLCPVDFSPSSLSALQFAFSLAQEADAQLTILHVFDWPSDDEALVGRFDVPEFRRAVEEQFTHRLEDLIPDDVRLWCTPSTSVSYGKPYREVLDVAQREQTDLIVMGVRGRNPVDLTLFGSTTNQVVRRASCPVLTLRQ